MSVGRKTNAHGAELQNVGCFGSGAGAKLMATCYVQVRPIVNLGPSNQLISPNLHSKRPGGNQLKSSWSTAPE